MRVFAVLFGMYLSIVLFRQSLRSRGEARSVFLVAGLLLLPPLIATYILYDGCMLSVFDPELAINQDASKWWVARVSQETGEPWFLNILAMMITFSSLYIGVTLLISLASSFYKKKKGVELLSMHRALLKWSLVLSGCVVLLNINLWPVLLGMGAASIVLGFALKEMLENLFTGMALDAEGAFHSGDWIRIGDSDTIGKVYEKNWRSTKLLTKEDESITVPNRLLGAEKILCFNKPGSLFARKLRVGTSYSDPPVKVKEVLRTILIREPRVAKDPPPEVRTIEYGDFSIVYEMKFWIRDYGEYQHINDSIMTKVWYAFQFYGIQIPFPIRTVHMKEREQLLEEESDVQRDVEGKMAFLRNLDFLNRHLLLQDFDFLARNSFLRKYFAHEHIIQKGEIGDALYLVMEGWCQVVLPDGRKRRLDAGQYFGEMGLLGARQRTADVLAGDEGATVLRIDKHCMDMLFRSHGDLIQEFEHIRDARREELPPEEPALDQARVDPLRRALQYAADFLRPW